MKTSYLTVDGEVLSVTIDGQDFDLVPDPLGSVAMALDAGGNVTDAVEYWPYGEVRSRTGTTDLALQYVGTRGYYNDSPRRDYVRARVLRKDLARWTTVDPLWPDENAYGYAGGNPTSGVDPSGLICWCPFRGSRGSVTIDCSCVGESIAIVPETGRTVVNPVKCGVEYPADGFYLEGHLYKVDGSTCVRVTCTSTSFTVSTCVNNLARCLGRGGPRPVPPGEFGGPPKELPNGVRPRPVRR